MVTATIGGIPVGTYGTGILTIPANITGDVTITSNIIKSLPTGVTMGQYTANEPSDAPVEIRTAFNGYKYLTFDGVAGRWIIIGAHGLLLGNNVGDPKNELDLGQVLLLSENLILNGDSTVMYRAFDNESPRQADWSQSDIKDYLNGSWLSSSGLDYYVNNGSIVPQSLKTAWYDGTNKATNETTDDNIFLLATNSVSDNKLYKDQDFCVETYLFNDSLRSVGIYWWLRSGADGLVDRAHYVKNVGTFTRVGVGELRGVRPAFVFKMTEP